MKKAFGLLLAAALVCGGAFVQVSPAPAAQAIELPSEQPVVPQPDASGDAASDLSTPAQEPGEPEETGSPVDPGPEVDPLEDAPNRAEDLAPTEVADSSDPSDPEEPETPLEIVAPVVAPGITGGKATVGKVATATQGDWGAADLTFSYQWQLGGADIPRATTAQFTPLPAHAGKQLSVVVTANRAGAAPFPASSTQIVVQPGSLTRGKVTISGGAVVGNTLTARIAAWKPAGVTHTLQWKRDGKAIPRATSTKYTLSAADRGKRITVTASGKLAGYTTAESTSPATGKVAAGTLRPTSATVSGSAIVGKTLAVRNAAWKPAGVKRTYQWKRDGKAIPRATSTKYRLTAADGGKRITVTVTGKLAGYTTATKTSKSTAKVLRVFTATHSPKIAGTARVGAALTATLQAWKPAAAQLSYQWLRNGKVISGARQASYTLTRADAGKKVAVRVTGKKTGYVSVSKTSKSKSIPLVMRAATPRVSGSALVGSQLSVNRGTWTGGTSFRYQWYRNGIAVPGKTGTTYRVTEGDVGSYLAVTVSGSKRGYAPETRVSGATSIVGYPTSTTVWGWDCPAWAPIKGNASSMIYHVPGSTYYSRTKPEVCFTTVQAAQQAGYRAPLR